MKKSIIYFIFSILVAIGFTSCINQRKYVYFQHEIKDTLPSAKTIDTNASYAIIFKKDDIVSIDVSAIDPEVVRPFNLNSGKEIASKSIGEANGYLIDANGNIEFPVLGTLKIAGLTRIETTNLLKERLKDYIKNNPIVNVRLQNFKITILGDVGKPGVYSIGHERLTLLEAIGYAGDLNITGERKNVLVIRDENGIKTETRVDMSSIKSLNSPVYYLHQNDIVYVEPSKSKVASTKPIGLYASIGVASTSLLISIVNLLSK